jgi:hypothetical protein
MSTTDRSAAGAASVVNDYCEFYCLSYHNETRATAMTRRFAAVGVALNIHPGVEHSDERIAGREASADLARLWSVTYGHLDMIRAFLATKKRYGLFCENDVCIHKDLVTELPAVMEAVDRTGVHIMLLGYMTVTKLGTWMHGYNLLHADAKRTYMTYPNDQWGVHLYMLTRAGAQHVLDLYAGGYADLTRGRADAPFSPDWTISKIQRRGLVYPMLAVEDGVDDMDHYQHCGQYSFHMATHAANYIPGAFL